GAIVCHVLHLVPEWKAAVAELVRVVHPGGVVLVDLGGQRDELHEMADHFQAAAGIERRHPGVENESDVAAVVNQFDALGVAVRELPIIAAERSLPPSALLSMWDQNRFSWTWPIAEGVRRRAVEATRAWAVE